MSRTIVLNVQITAAPGTGPELLKHFAALADSSRQEAGCVHYFLHSDPTDPHKIMLYEAFKDQAALDEHIAAPHHQAFLRWRETQKPDPVAAAAVSRWEPVT